MTTGQVIEKFFKRRKYGHDWELKTFGLRFGVLHKEDTYRRKADRMYNNGELERGVDKKGYTIYQRV